MWPSTPRIRKDTRASSKLFSRRVADVIFEAYLTAMTGDRNDELAALYLSMIEVALTSSWLVWIFNSYASLAIFFIIHETIYTTRVSAMFDFYCRA